MDDWGVGSGPRGFWVLTVLQLLSATGQNAAWEHPSRGQTLQRQHALALLSVVAKVEIRYVTTFIYRKYQTFYNV